MDEDYFQCPRCKRETLRGAHFCMGCGTRLDAKGAPESSSQPKLPAVAPAPPPLPAADSANWLAADLKPSKAVPPPLPSLSKKPAVPTPVKNEAPISADAVDAGFADIEPDRASPTAREEKRMPQFSREEVLKRLKLKQGLSKADLSGLDLSGAVLDGADLSRADLDGANLEGAKLRGANLKNASLREARLTGADLSHANCDKADLEGAKLDGAKLDGANFKRATLERCSLVGATLTGACLTGAELSGSDLSRARLKQADLSHAELTAAKLAGAELESATLDNATLEDAKLDGANLSQASLHDCNLAGASAVKARFTGASLLRCNLSRAKLVDAELGDVDARHASFENAELGRANFSGARLGKATLIGIQLEGARADAIDLSEQGDGSERLLGARAINYLRTGKTDADGDGTRYFGRGDVLRDATLEFGAHSSIQVDSRFENCSLTLGEGAELVIGETGVLKDCQIQGGGNITIHGRFFERQAPGIVGPRSLVVSARGAMVGAVEQSPEATVFAFEPGCKLRVKILRPAQPQILPEAAE
jgi:uncharacterized protein YjbI with pentapeptide repeats